MLLEHGASVDETDIDRDDEHGNHEHCPTPVATSALYARENVLRALLEVTPESSGAAVPVTGWTPLMLAASSGNKASDEGNKHLHTYVLVWPWVTSTFGMAARSSTAD